MNSVHVFCLLMILACVLGGCEEEASQVQQDEEIVLPVRPGEFVFLGIYGSVSTAWVLPREEASALPRWTTGKDLPLSYNEALRIVEESGSLPEESRLIRIGFQNSNEERNDPNFEDLFFFVVDFLVPEGAEETFRTFVVLPNGRLLQGRQIEKRIRRKAEMASPRKPSD